MKARTLLAIIAVLGLTLLSTLPAFAAQGQITEVNPSGGRDPGIYITLPSPAQGQITDVNPTGIGFAQHAHPPGLSGGLSNCPEAGIC